MKETHSASTPTIVFASHFANKRRNEGCTLVPLSSRNREGGATATGSDPWTCGGPNRTFFRMPRSGSLSTVGGGGEDFVSDAAGFFRSISFFGCCFLFSPPAAACCCCDAPLPLSSCASFFCSAAAETSPLSSYSRMAGIQ